MLAVLDLGADPFAMEAELEAGGASEEEEGEARMEEEAVPLAREDEEGVEVRLVEEFFRLKRGAILLVRLLWSEVASTTVEGGGCFCLNGGDFDPEQSSFFRDLLLLPFKPSLPSSPSSPPDSVQSHYST